ncbi:EAL domain-containing protein [Klebsiella variicola subsp. variicola]|uniref:cyclic-di-GMP phosphodiesterase MrkJ n=1 Tax=Klebsiella variicola TaxID=244366 RepID=UPI0035A05B71
MNTKITEDNILSRNDIAVRYVFQKMFSPQGTLVAVECLSRFDNLTVSPEYFFRHATAAVRERIFLQLALIEKHKEWFLHNNISATINVDDHILNLLRQKEIKDKIAALTCVHFEVTENAENLLNNSLAAWQNPQDTSLWLDDFGSGYAGINAIRGYHFDYVKIDKDFFWHLMRKESGRQLMDALVTFLSRNHHNVIIEGVESEDHKKWLQGMEWFAIQGHYWQEVSIEQLVADDITR